MSATSQRSRRYQVSPGRWLGRATVTTIVVFFILFFIIPIVWLLIATSKAPRQLLTTGAFEWGSLHALSANWSALVHFQGGVIFHWLQNSALYALSALVITLVTSIPAGYALALGHFHGRKVLLTTTLIVMLIPNTALVIPVFLELAAAHQIAHPLAVILPFSFFPFGVYLTYIYFSTSVPRDLLDAARLDGCGELSVFSRVALPLARPVVALVGFFSFVANWNNYFLPFLTDRKSTRLNSSH